MADAGAVRVGVVGRAAQLRVMHEQEIGGVHPRQGADVELRRPRPHARPVVRVAEIGGGGSEERRARPRSAPRRAHVEHHPELGTAVGLEAKGIDAASRLRGHGQGQARAPPRVVEVVVVEVDGAVLPRRPAPVHLAAVPVVAGDGALRRVHRPAMELVGRAVGDAVGGDLGGEVPETDRLPITRDPGPVDLAVEMPHRPEPAVLDRSAGGAEEEGARRRRRRHGDGRGNGRRPLEAGRVVGERRLAERHRPRGKVHRRKDVIPAPGGEGRAGGHAHELAPAPLPPI